MYCPTIPIESRVMEAPQALPLAFVAAEKLINRCVLMSYAMQDAVYK